MREPICIKSKREIGFKRREALGAVKRGRERFCTSEKII
jgi:hypothetical protein